MIAGIGVAALIAVAAIAVVVVRKVVLADHARAVPVEAAVKHFRSEVAPAAPTTTGAPTPLSLMPFGIYRYRTTGQESIDALGGTTHHYPAETTISVIPDGCGVLLRWDALKERRDEWRLCVDAAGIELQPRGLQYHQFYGQVDSEDLVCQPAVPVVGRSDAAPAATGRIATDHVATDQSCTLGGDPWHPQWSILGNEQRTVEGVMIPVVHARMTVNDNSTYDEHTTLDWYLDQHGLPVEVSSTKESKSPSPVGAVTYRETYTLQLESTTALR